MNTADTAMIQRINQSKRENKNKDSKCPKCGGELKINTMGIYCSKNCGFETII